MESKTIGNAGTSTDQVLGVDWDYLDQALGRILAPPPGSFTVAQYAERYGITKNAARHRLGLLIAGGALGTEKRGNRRYYYPTK